MGGNAFKELGTAKRLTSEEYILVSGCILLKVLGFEAEKVRSVAEKKTHGDIDILIYHEMSDEEILRQLKQLNKDVSHYYNVLGFIRNGETSSVALSGENPSDFIQVDFIRSKDPCTARLCYDFNDLGGLIGKLARVCGLKLTDTGLYYPVYINYQKYDDVAIASNIPDILALLDLDLGAWQAGFSTYEEAFVWLLRSKFADPRKIMAGFTQEGLRRNEKRETFQRFKEFISTEHTLPLWAPSVEDPKHFVKNRLQFFNSAGLPEGITERHWFHAADNFQQGLKEVHSRYAYEQLYSAKMNGRVIIEATGFSGKAVAAIRKGILLHPGWSELIIGGSEDAILIKLIEGKQKMEIAWNELEATGSWRTNLSLGELLSEAYSRGTLPDSTYFSIAHILLHSDFYEIEGFKLVLQDIHILSGIVRETEYV